VTVLESVQGSVKPGRGEDFLAQAAEAHKLFERLGAKAVRLSIAAVGAPNDSWVFSMESENGEEWGELRDRTGEDLEFQAFVARVRSADAPSVISSITTSMEIPLRAGNRERGNVVEIHVSRPVPGRMEETLAQSAKVCDLIEARGATNARLFQIGYAGASSGLLMLGWEFHNLKELGRVGDLWSSDPAMIEIAATQYAADATVTPVFDAVYQVVPL
jgi:hypothetical protein